MKVWRRRLAGVALLAIVALAAWLRLGPIDPRLLDASKHQSTTILDRNGEVLYEPLAATGNRAQWLKTIPPHVKRAAVAAEDHRFYNHPGIDPIGVMRAAWRNVRSGRVVEGGSTITQQVAKLLLNAKSRSWTQKTREAVLALRLEHRYSKDEILAMYLNRAPYGNRITGIGRASQTYFGCPPENLTLAQAAFLAALPQRPTTYNPLRDPKMARARQLKILDQMRLTGEERKHARAERLVFAKSAQPAMAMHFVERVWSAAAKPPLSLQTTLDLNLQREVLGIIGAHRETLVRHGASAVAVAVLDNATGEWLAWEGSGDYFGEGFGGAIDGVSTPRQPGSTLKPFTYALAFERGESPATVLADVPSHFPTGEEGVVYTPRNYDGRYRGPLRVRAALAGSENIPAVAMLAKLGPEQLLRLLRNSGFTGLDRTADYYGLGLTLGNSEVTLEQLVTAYATFARGGKTLKPTLLLRPPSTAHRQLFSQCTSFWITDILTDAAAREYAFGTGGSLEFPFPVAVKTGTSQAYRDNWTIGYTREVTVGVWVGNFDRRELRGSSGVTGAEPIFNAVMLAAMKRARGQLPIGDPTPIVAPPENVESIEICALSGLRPSTWCPAVEKEWLATDTPARFCSWHHDGFVDVPAELRITPVSSRPPRPAGGRRYTSFKIAHPPDGATYLIDPTLRTEFQALRLRAVASSRVAWHVDDRRIGTSLPDSALEWPLAPGSHVITAVDAGGRKDSVTIFVK